MLAKLSGTVMGTLGTVYIYNRLGYNGNYVLHVSPKEYNTLHRQKGYFYDKYEYTTEDTYMGHSHGYDCVSGRTIRPLKVIKDRVL
jgi:hypothetical protein